jgi:hypothetical protein
MPGMTRRRHPGGETRESISGAKEMQGGSSNAFHNPKRMNNVPVVAIGTLLILVTFVALLRFIPADVNALLRLSSNRVSDKKFTPIPTSKLRHACVDKAQTAVVRSFQSRGFKVYDLKGYNWDPLEDCYANGTASILWTKHKPPKDLWKMAQPWQRHSWIPYQNVMSSKSKFLQSLREYQKKTGRKMDFIPESFMLPADRDLLLERFNSSLNEPWVTKLSATDNGIGIAMLGPESPELHTLATILQKDSNPKTYMPQIREDVVFTQKDDTRGADKIEKAKKRSEKLNDPIIVQRYICHELSYLGKKFDLRIYYLVASASPLVVMYHDGYLRVSPHEYNDQVFESTSKHLTNLGRTNATEKNTVSFDDWETQLKIHVKENAKDLRPSVRADPLDHIRKQIMSALANVVAANRRKGFHGHRTYTTMENGFALMVRIAVDTHSHCYHCLSNNAHHCALQAGDFIVDRKLNVWMTEAQSSPGLGHETAMKRKMNDKLLPSTVDVLVEMNEKQMAKKPILPIENGGDFRLIYTDEYHYRYDFEREPQRGPC